MVSHSTPSRTLSSDSTGRVPRANRHVVANNNGRRDMMKDRRLNSFRRTKSADEYILSKRRNATNASDKEEENVSEVMKDLLRTKYVCCSDQAADPEQDS